MARERNVNSMLHIHSNRSNQCINNKTNSLLLLLTRVSFPA